MRTRKQNGEVYDQNGAWFMRWYDWKVVDGELKRKRCCKSLGPKASMSRKQVERIAEEFLETINKPALPSHTSVRFNE